MGFFDCNKNEERIPIDEIDDIYTHTERIVEALRGYDSLSGTPVQQAALSEKATLIGRNGEYTGKNLTAVHFQGKRYPVNTWKEGMIGILTVLAKERPKTFVETALTMKGRKRPYITRNAGELRQAEKVPGTELYVEVNLGARSVARLCYRLLNELGYSDEDLVLEVS